MKVLYNPTELIVIGELTNDEQYSIPDSVVVYEGSLNDFYIEYPEYIQQEDKFDEPIEGGFTDYEIIE